MKTGAAGRSAFIHLFLIALVGLAAYSNTFNAPFQLDETPFITNNPVVHELKYFMDPALASGLPQYGALRDRYVGYLSFALNYRLHGTDVRGYHVVNTAVHIAAAALIYLLTVLTFKTPFLAGSALAPRSCGVALLAALLFVAHPLQTEAVTYVFQRLASLAAFFYLLSVVCYVRARLGGRLGYAFYALSLLAAGLAIKTKENAFTLPVALAVYEALFFPMPISSPANGKSQTAIRRALHIVPFFLLALAVALARGEEGGLVAAAGGYGGISRGDYLLTQLSVVATYIRLLLLPVGQNFDHEHPLYTSLFTSRVFLSLLLVLFLIALALRLVRCSAGRAAELRLAAFGILFFFIALSVESTVIPLPTLINEYRVYLPSAGMALSVSVLLLSAHNGLRAGALRRGLALLMALLPLVLCGAAYERNAVWQSRVSLWEDTARKSPHSVRAWNNLANAYWDEGRRAEAIEGYKRALDLDPDNGNVHNNLGLAYEAEGRIDDAIKHYRAALEASPGYDAPRRNLARAFAKKGLSVPGLP